MQIALGEGLTAVLRATNDEMVRAAGWGLGHVGEQVAVVGARDQLAHDHRVPRAGAGRNRIGAPKESLVTHEREVDGFAAERR